MKKSNSTVDKKEKDKKEEGQTSLMIKTWNHSVIKDNCVDTTDNQILRDISETDQCTFRTEFMIEWQCN
jgi:hypothetical protein